jgi:hypothetical protein
LIVLIKALRGSALNRAEAFASAELAIQIVQWEDVFVVIDGGTGRASDYVLARRMLAEQGSRYAAGMGCLVIIPVDAKPPSEPAREAMKAALATLRLRCLCWLVEGAGFQAAMVRGVLTGLRLVAARSYETHVSRDLDEALRWMLPRLEGGTERIEAVSRASTTIRASRAGRQHGSHG